MFSIQYFHSFPISGPRILECDPGSPFPSSSSPFVLHARVSVLSTLRFGPFNSKMSSIISHRRHFSLYQCHLYLTPSFWVVVSNKLGQLYTPSSSSLVSLCGSLTWHRNLRQKEEEEKEIVSRHHHITTLFNLTI